MEWVHGLPLEQHGPYMCQQLLHVGSSCRFHVSTAVSFAGGVTLRPRLCLRCVDAGCLAAYAHERPIANISICFSTRAVL